jgi:hypothetical protein
MRLKIFFWVPMAFCTFLCYTALRSSDEGWRPPFFSFLPMCFFFVAFAFVAVYREVQSLRARLEKLEEKTPS